MGLPGSMDLPVDSPGSNGKDSAPPFSPADGLAAWCLGQGEGPFLSREPGMIFGHLGRKIREKREWALSPPKATSPSVFSEASVWRGGRQWALICDILPQPCLAPLSNFSRPPRTLPTALLKGSGGSCRFGRCVFILVEKTDIITSPGSSQKPRLPFSAAEGWGY